MKTPKNMKAPKEKRTKFGRDLEQAFRDLAQHLREGIEAESVGAKSGKWTSYTLPDSFLTAARIKDIRQSVASSTRDFERQFHIPARTMEAYEQGLRRPNPAMCALLRIIEREPDAARRALAA